MHFNGTRNNADMLASGDIFICVKESLVLFNITCFVFQPTSLFAMVLHCFISHSFAQLVPVYITDLDTLALSCCSSRCKVM